MRGTAISMQLWNCETDITNKPESLRSLIKEVIELTSMNALGDVSIKKGHDQMPGLSALQMIDTSHIAIHCFSINVAYLFNIESCREFDSEKIKKHILSTLNPAAHRYRYYPLMMPVSVVTND